MNNKIVCEDNLVLASKTISDLKERFWNWMKALENKGQR